MITLLTGTPGAGKTVAAIDLAIRQGEEEGRPVYLCGVRKPKLDLMPGDVRILEDGAGWWECPERSIILLDEAQEIFRSRPPGAPVPLEVQHLERHRHNAHDLYLTTQDPGIISHHVRRLVGRHIHLRALPLKSSATWYEWPEIQPKPADYHAKQATTVTKKWKRPAHVFDWYESTVDVTKNHQGRIPGGLWFRLIPVVAIVGWLIWSNASGGGLFGFFNRDTDDLAPSSARSAEFASAGYSESRSWMPSASAGGDDGQRFKTLEEWSAFWRPRVSDLPWSAPAYDDIRQPVDFPRPNCVIIHGQGDDVEDCRCWTQQATALTVSRDTCIGFVRRGVFDPTRERFQDQQAARGREGGRQPRDRAPNLQTQNPLPVINNSLK